MIKELMQNYGEIGALGTFILLMVWYVRFQTKQQTERESRSDKERIKIQEKRDNDQKEERNYYRDLIDGSLQKNTVLNAKGLSLQKIMIKDLKSHNGHSEKFSEKVLKAFDILCDRMNGGSPESMKMRKGLEFHKTRGMADRRKEEKKVKVERRK